jgi:hypothetical protein
MMTSRAIAQQRRDWAAGALLKRLQANGKPPKSAKNSDDVLDAARPFGKTREMRQEQPE